MTQRAFLRTSLAVTLATAMLIVLTQATHELDPSDSALARLAMAMTSAFMAGSAQWAAWRSNPGGPVRRAWRWIAAAGWLWTAADSVTLVQLLLRGEVPLVSLVDPLRLAAGFAALAGLLQFPRTVRTRRSSLKLLVDGVLIGATLLLIATTVSLYDDVSTDSSLLERLTLIAYPVLEMTVSAVALVLVHMGAQRDRTHFLFLCGAFLAFAVGDIALMLAELGLIVQVSEPYLPLWLIGNALLALAALSPSATSSREIERARTGVNPYFITVVVNAPMALSLFILVTRVTAPDPGQELLGAVILGASVVRQLLMTLENVELNRELETLVAEQTAEVTRLARQSQLVLESATEGIVGMDRSGLLTFSNPAAEQMLGRSAQSLIGQPASRLFAEVTDVPRSRRPPPLAGPLETGDRVIGVSGDFVGRDGLVFPVEYSASPLVGDSGVAGVVLTFHDVSQRREVERMKDQFLSVVSHELRTPMTAVRGSLGLMAGGAVGELPAQAQHMVTIALENSERLTRLINDILQLERLESGTIPLEVTTVPAEQLIQSAVQSVQAVADEVDVRLVVAPTDERVLADPDRIVQVLTNLIGNAVKFSPPGGEIRITAARIAAARMAAAGMTAAGAGGEGAGSHGAGEEVLMSVSDQGRGIPEHLLGNIFDRFTQVDSSDSRQKGGTGLGLAICKGLVEAHGGRIWAVSPAAGSPDGAPARSPAGPSDSPPAGSPDGAASLPGSTFHFTLPAAR